MTHPDITRIEAAKKIALDSPPQTVAVICGGKNTEHDVSLTSAETVIQAIETLGHTVLRVVIERDGTWSTKAQRGLQSVLPEVLATDIVFPVLHGMGGEDGTLQGMLEFLGVPYVGSGVEASAIAMAKEKTKVLVAAKGVRVAEGTVVDMRNAADAALVETNPGALVKSFPVFVKASRSGSSYGASRVEAIDGLVPAIREAAEIDPIVLIEEEIVGREIDFGVLELVPNGVVVSEGLEILADPDEPFFTAEAKYFSDKTVFNIPADLDPQVRETMRNAALVAYQTLGCSGLARADFFLTENGQVVFNEINTIPGLGPMSQFPRMWKAAGLEYHEMIAILLSTASKKNSGT